jgi:small nuclear ribonucleoprotein (snRNP)-like protein
MISGFEKELNCNTLIGIVRACEGKRVQIDLRNELHIYGRVESVFGDMNIIMSNAYVMTPAFKIYENETDARSKSKFYEEITLRGRNIRFVHVPDEIDMVKALQRQILAVTRPNLKKRDQKQFKKRPRNANTDTNKE